MLDAWKRPAARTISAPLLPPPLDADESPPRVLDLFAGTGGLAVGFRTEGFDVVGVDRIAASAAVFRLNDLGDHIRADLATQSVTVRTPVIVGGPPCRPWSPINVQRRGRDHDQHRLLERFFEHVEGLQPELFLMENVPAIRGDKTYQSLVNRVSAAYSVEARVIRYADYGAATKRRRLFTAGVRKGTHTAGDFFRLLDAERAPATSVGARIGWLRHFPRGAFPDHEWSRLSTIGRYQERYRTGQYGWVRLTFDAPAPSFGSVSKTYILHPDSQPEQRDTRVLSVREVLLIMGFDPDFHMPRDASLTTRYQMAADAVSPVFSAACARAVKHLLWGPSDPASGVKK